MTASAMPATRNRGLFLAIVFKEIRDGLKIAFVSLGIVVVGQFISLGFQKMMESAGVEVGGSASPFSFTLFTLTSALGALLIGRALVVHENRGDRWGFLAHRPVQRSTLFFGKAVAGAVLYFAAAGIPLIFVTAWMAAPGSRPMPWDSSMALPGVADMLCGLVYLLAAMLVGMREARWYGSRFLPLGAALACSGVVLEVSHFSQALAVVAIGIVIVGMAALTNFVGGGRYEPLGRWGRATLGLTIVPGLMLAGSVALGVAVLFVGTRQAVRSGMHSTRYAIAGDGSIVQRVAVQRFFPTLQQVVAVNDLQGRAIERYQDSVARGKLTTGVVSTPALSLHPDVPGTLESLFSGYRGTRDVFVQLTTMPPAPSELSWYFVRKAGSIAAYNNRSARLVGWMGPDGFSLGESLPTHRFEGALRSNSEYAYFQPVLAFPSAVYRVDLHERGIRKVFSASPGEIVLGAVTSGDSAAMAAYGPRAKFAVIATNTSVYVQAADGTSEVSAARDADSVRGGTLTVSRAVLAPGSPTFLWYSASDRPFINGEPGTAAGHITAFADGNKVVAQVSIPRDTAPAVVEKISAGALLSAAAIPVTWRLTPRALRLYRRFAGSPVAGPRPWQRSDTVDWSVSVIASLLVAGLALMLGGLFAFEQKRRMLWAVIGFVLGPLGVLLMLSLVDWPVREACPSCARERVVTRARCEHCDAPFLPPPVDGTEIFEMATV
jgi:hypothetical protein